GCLFRWCRCRKSSASPERPLCMGQNPPASLLIVDDDEGLLRLIERSLRRAGYATATATTGQAALARLQQAPADLLLLDLNLPDITGQEIVRQLTRNGSSLPFIIVTGLGDAHVAVQWMKQGAIDYLLKDQA